MLNLINFIKTIYIKKVHNSNKLTLDQEASSTISRQSLTPVPGASSGDIANSEHRHRLCRRHAAPSFLRVRPVHAHRHHRKYTSCKRATVRGKQQLDGDLEVHTDEHGAQKQLSRHFRENLLPSFRRVRPIHTDTHRIKSTRHVNQLPCEGNKSWTETWKCVLTSIRENLSPH